MRGGHGGGSGVKIDGRAACGDGTVQHGLGEGAAEREAAGEGAYPETLELPGLHFDGGGNGAPGDEAGGLVLHIGDETAAALLEVAQWKAGGFFLKRAEAEAGGAGLGDDEASVLEQQFTRLGECAIRSRRHNFL